MHTLYLLCNPHAEPRPILRPIGHTYDKLDFWQRERIWELHRAGWKGAKIARYLGEGDDRRDPPLPPVKITAQAVNSQIRTMKLERDKLYSTKLASVPTEDALFLLRRKLSLLANAEADRLAERQKAGKLDGDQLRKLAGACERIERLELAAAQRAPLPDKPPSKPDQDQGEEEGKTAPSFADSLLDAAAKREAAAIPATPDAEPESPDPEHASAVPDDLSAQDTAPALGR
jgi:hypothetical protein